MKFAINVLCPPQSDSSFRALRFASALLESDHTLVQVFFYQDGVYHGNGLASPPQDELCIAKEWLTIKHNGDTRLCVCIASGIRRGVIDQCEAQRHRLEHFNLAEGFEIVGLGQLIESTRHVDRLLTFG